MKMAGIREEQIKSFQADGYLHLPDYLSESMLGATKQALMRVIDKIDTFCSEEVYCEDREDPASLKQIQHLENKEDFFQQLISTGGLYELAQEIFQEEPIPKNIQYFNKPPKKGSATPAHQDGYYFMLNPCRALTMWLALEEVDESNGCISYVKASQRLGLRAHQCTKTLGFSQGITDFPNPEDQAQMVKIKAQPGDLLIHDAMTIHSADENSSSRSRKAIGLIYYAASARVDKLAHATYQQQLANDLRKENKI
jgi:phytanoyl-CoA hydroxylase